MTVNDMAYFESTEADVPYALKLVRQIILVCGEFIINVTEDPIVLALSNIKGFAIPRINEAVDVKLQLSTNMF
jgi:hypothetical protein